MATTIEPKDNPIPLGNPMEWQVQFTDINGNPFDPNSAILISITDPNGGVVNYAYPAQLTKVSVGVYSVTITSAIRGWYVGTGSGLLADGTPVTTLPVAQKVI